MASNEHSLCYRDENCGREEIRGGGGGGVTPFVLTMLPARRD